jgi:hypothetical protein
MPVSLNPVYVDVASSTKISMATLCIPVTKSVMLILSRHSRVLVAVVYLMLIQMATVRWIARSNVSTTTLRLFLAFVGAVPLTSISTLTQTVSNATMDVQMIRIRHFLVFVDVMLLTLTPMATAMPIALMPATPTTLSGTTVAFVAVIPPTPIPTRMVLQIATTIVPKMPTNLNPEYAAVAFLKLTTTVING